MGKLIFIILIILLTFFGCNTNNAVEDEIATIPIDLKIEHFDQEFATATPETIPNLKNKYPFLFPEQFPDSIWVAKLQDTLQMELSREVKAVFKDFDAEEKDLKSLFQHIKYYFPQYQVPRVITLISDVDYKNRMILTDSLLLIGLQNYLGAEHYFYGGLSRFISTELDKQYLTVDVARAFAKSVVPLPQDRSFLSQLIYYGKELYLLEKLIPTTTDAQKLAYSQKQYEWAMANEEQMWRYFIERELLYSTDSKLAPRFLDPAPFSKFQLELDNESPGRVGRYMGWQIVRAFMENNKVTLPQLLASSAEDIFEKSNYKPRK
jgi:gliding motility-associated lipoprotein GldB